MGTDLPPFRRAGCHLWLVIFFTVSCIGVYLVLLVIPSYRSGLYLPTSPEEHWRIEQSLDNYWHLGGVALVVVSSMVFVLPLVIGSVLLHGRALTRRDRILWVLLVIITVIIVQQTLSMAGAMLSYMLD